ncbi:MAG: DUF2336 domain-containing protein [Alphaproteobacteria bacterium]|nr:DUF2336 domain-containing protein [Alphaproteobacteria bacterium]
MTDPQRRSADKQSDTTAAEAMAIARSDDAEARRRLAQRTDIAPELLFYLAEDAETSVRVIVAENSVTPRQADEFLARDAEESVRVAVAAKMAKVAPGIESERRTPLRALSLEVLETLARDTVKQVRARLADSLKNLDSAPPELVERVVEVLARDTAIEVAGPVLEHSSLLSDDVLLSIVEAPNVDGAVGAVSRRRGVSATVSDAVARSGDDEAVASLLANESAQIREQTLDQLIEAAPSKPSWHTPLVHRPKLAARQIDRLSEFVADALVTELSKRNDLNAETKKRLRGVVAKRLEAGKEDPTIAERNTAVNQHIDGQLDERALSEAVAAGRRAYVMAALAVRSALSEPVVHAIMGSGSARAVVALAWKAGLSMTLAEQLQLRLAYIEPKKLLRAQRNGGYPLKEDQLAWEIKVFDQDNGAG